MESDTVDTPSWLTTEFVEDVLRSGEDYPDITAINKKVQLAVGKGDNYTSILYRVTIDFKRKNNGDTETTSLIIKALSNLEILAKFIQESKIFEKETSMYLITIPSMFRLLQDKNPESKIPKLTPYCYKTSKPHTLILQDLKTLGFKMADRHARLDLPHCIVALKGLAHFHALSVALHDRDQSSMDAYEESVYTEKSRDIMMNFMSTTLEALANVVTKWPGFEKYPDKIRAVIPIMWDRLMEMLKTSPGSLCVLNHGDCWVNNMMFHYCPNTGKVDEVRFVDFQLSRFASPTLDLQYFINTSPNEDVRSQHMGHLLQVYHEELCHTLQILECERQEFTLEYLKKEFEEKNFFGFIAACSVLPVVLADPNDAFDMENVKEDGSGIDTKRVEKTYSGSRYRDAFQKLLPYFDNKGLL